MRVSQQCSIMKVISNSSRRIILLIISDRTEIRRYNLIWSHFCTIFYQMILAALAFFIPIRYVNFIIRLSTPQIQSQTQCLLPRKFLFSQKYCKNKNQADGTSSSQIYDLISKHSIDFFLSKLVLSIDANFSHKNKYEMVIAF